MSAMGRTDETPQAGVTGEFVGKTSPLGWENKSLQMGKRMSRIRLARRRKPDGKSTSRIGWIRSRTGCGRYPADSK